MQIKKPLAIGLSILLSALLIGCGSDDDSTSSSNANVLSLDVDPDLFLASGLAEEITTESCTLSSGAETTCYSITIVGNPTNEGAEIGDFCPTTITDTADSVGIWFDGTGNLYDITGEFITGLADTYNDANFVLHQGVSVNVTDTQAACEGAAQPNVEEQYKNNCVVCDINYYNGGIETTFQIPVSPVYLDEPSTLSGDTGVALNGVVMALSAPVADILSNYTIAAFDDCAGHVNPFEGYHYHGANGCTEIAEQEDEHSAMLGYALDGYGIFAMANAAGEEHSDLDECRGAVDDTRGYHYHSASVEENMFIGCFHGDTVASDEVGPGGAGGAGGDAPPQ